MIGLLKRLFVYSAGDAPELDHLPLNTTDKQIDTPTVEKPKVISAPPDWQHKMLEARRKLGKPFVAHTKVPRMTDPSRDLDYLNDQTEIAKRTATVTHIDERKRK